LSSFFFLSIAGFAQDLLKVTEQRNQEYPYIDITLEYRNPNGLDKESISITEGNTSVTILSSKEVDQEIKDNGVCALILFENHYSSARNKQREFFKSVIRDGAPDVVDSNDDFYFASFDWAHSDIDNRVLFLRVEWNLPQILIT
jgi:hypothetical protein